MPTNTSVAAAFYPVWFLYVLEDEHCDWSMRNSGKNNLHPKRGKVDREDGRVYLHFAAKSSFFFLFVYMKQNKKTFFVHGGPSCQEHNSSDVTVQGFCVLANDHKARTHTLKTWHGKCRVSGDPINQKTEKEKRKQSQKKHQKPNETKWNNNVLSLFNILLKNQKTKNNFQGSSLPSLRPNLCLSHQRKKNR